MEAPLDPAIVLPPQQPEVPLPGGDPLEGQVDHDARLGELEDFDSDDDEEEEENEYRMGMTEVEHQWALTIKEEVVQNTPRFRSPPISDMMIAQIALVSIEEDELGDLVGVTERLERLQRIRKRYEVVESLEAGKSVLKRLVEDVYPGFLLSFSFDAAEQSYVSVVDLTKGDAARMHRHDHELLAFRGFYYVHHCQNAHLEAVRAGFTTLCECHGYSRKSVTGQVGIYREWGELAAGYPLILKRMIHFHTGVFLNLMLSMAKRFLPPKVAKKCDCGYVSSRGTLSELYLVPSLEAANRRTLNNLYAALELRYKNEASFTLQRWDDSP